MGCMRDAILDALENLTADEFKKFKMKLLSVPLREGYGRIPRGTLLPMDAVDLTDKLVSYYLEAYSAELTVLVLCNIGMQEVAEQLQETLRKGPGTTPAGIKAPPQTAAKPGPEGHPALPGGRPGAELRHLPQQRSHRQPLAVPAILPGVSDFFNIHMKIQLVLGVSSYFQPGSSCGAELHIQVPQWLR
ncbi:apoptosis-associated speck-like protein containing a CARD isoform X2 [Neophocaena asiaeorientalis asiaeorientalis]|uniref:Apoptosis-associated speck-like protein containing a CARD isoform X2 n=1 Tax=Neophocaena asiaeorientalis asiaeorientalis TaxID=1706337 RepID=A0A341BD88_NEOAA|nr:apoptosis-associated speck-like protein containing a CARD isoform X2 [Neophocaena asiaeorientalis asiaeorientalis]